MRFTNPIRTLPNRIFLLTLLVTIAAATCAAQATSPASRPVLFVHGLCGDSQKWTSLRSSLASALNADSSTLYPNLQNFDVYYDASTGQVHFLSNGVAIDESAIPNNARFFSILFFDIYSGTYSPNYVAQVSILNKADELAHVLHEITRVTQIRDVLVIGHSMGGLVARAYLEGMASVGECYNNIHGGIAGTPTYSNGLCSPNSTPYAGEIASLTTIDTPHGGSDLAEDFTFDYGELFNCALGENTDTTELTPGSDLLNNLNYYSTSIASAAPIPSQVTVNSIESYLSGTPAWNFLSGGINDTVITYDNQSLQLSIPTSRRNGIQFPDWANVFDLGTILPQAACQLSTNLTYVAILHYIECVGGQASTQGLVHSLIKPVENGAVSSVAVNATLDSGSGPQPWSGLVNYYLESSNAIGATANIYGTSVPFTFPDVPIGTYSIVYQNGGPSNASTLPAVTPPLSALTSSNWNPTFTLGFTSNVVTAPVPTTTTASGISGDGATLNGNVNPGGAVTSVWFEWGTSNTLQTYNVTPTQTISSGTTTQFTSYSQGGLSSGVTYYYRLAATNGGATMRGNILQFTTLNTLPAPTLSTPTNGSSGVSTTPAMAWTAVSGATSYRLMIATNSTALPIDSTSSTCGAGCVLNVTPPANSYTPDAGILSPGATYYWEVHARSTLQYGSWSQVGTFTTVGPSVTGVSLSPTALVSGGTATMTVTISGPAPISGSQVAISSSANSTLPVPATIFIAGGALVGSATVQAGTVTASTSVLVTATYGASTASTTVNVSPATGSVGVSSLVISPSSIVGGVPSLGIVNLTGPAPNSAVISLGSNTQSVAQVPATVIAIPGYSNVTFPITTFFTSGTVSSTITASYNGTLTGAAVTVLPVGVSGLTFYPSSLTAGGAASFTVFLTGPPPAGAVVSLTNSNASALQIPSTIAVPTGANNVTVTGTTSSTATQTLVNVTASYNGSTGSGTLTLAPSVPVLITSMGFSPQTVTGGQSGTGYVYLNQNAPAGGVAVTLTTSDSGLLQVVPAVVTVPSGIWYTSFPVSSSAVSAISNVTMTGTYAGASSSVNVTLVPPLPYLASLTFSSSTITAGVTTTGTVTLTAPSPLGGMLVNLSSSFYAICPVQNSLYIPQGQTSATFSVTPPTYASINPVTITASYSGTSQVANLIIVSPGTPIAPSSLTFSPSAVIGGGTTTGTVMLSGQAPSGGAILSLTSDNSALQVPPTIVVPSGASTTTFIVSSSTVSVIETATITLSYNGLSKSQLVTLKPLTNPPLGTVPFVVFPLMPLGHTPGSAGYSLTLDGSGFVSGAQVLWNGTILPTTYLNASQLQATVPAGDVQSNGTANLSVLNPGLGMIVSNQLPEHLTYSSSVPSFQTSSTTITNSPTSVAVADFNRDGKPDMVVVTANGTLSVLMGNGDGTFGPELLQPGPFAASAVFAGDFNGDGKMDIATTVNSSLRVFLGHGDGTFTQQPDTPLPASTSNYLSIAGGDLNGDGALDLVVPNNTQAYVLLGNGDGTFRPATSVGSVTNALSAAVADLNGDGKLDVILNDSLNQAVAVLLGNGDGTFQPQKEYSTNGYAQSFIVADLNGDGHPDVAVANLGSAGTSGSGIAVLLGKGDGTFSAATNYGAGQNYYYVAEDDVNGDGKLDLLIVQGLNQSPYLLYLGNGDGTFSTTPISVGPPQAVLPIAIADLNSDGAPDVIIPTGGGTISFLLQSIAPILQANPSSLAFVGTQGAGSPPPSTVALANTGGGAAMWTASSSQAWATLGDTSGTAPSTLTVSINPSGLSAGTYNGMVTLTVPGASNSPVLVPVTLTLNNPLPLVTSLSPASAPAGGASFSLTVNGFNFVSGATVQWNGSARTTTLVSSNQLTATINASDISSAGAASVTVLNFAPGGGVSSALSFSVSSPAPTLTSLLPSSAMAGATSFTLTATGANFVSGATVNWNGVSRPTVYVSSTKLTATINASDVASAGTFPVTVTNSDGSGISNPVNFTVNNPVPTVGSLSPTSAIAGGSSFTLTVTGTNYLSSSVVNWAGSARAIIYVSGTKLTCTINAADIAVAGTFKVTVTNPSPGGGTSAPKNFTVNNPVPTLASISPPSATAGGTGFTLTVTGTNFISGSKVRWNGVNLTTTFVNSTSLKGSVPASDVKTAGTASVTVFSPTPGGGTSVAQTFTINNPVPSIASLSPSSATHGTVAFTLTVSGSGFVNGSQVKWNGSARTTTYVSATKLTASITASDIAVAGSASITVTNISPGGGTSNSKTFTIK